MMSNFKCCFLLLFLSGGILVAATLGTLEHNPGTAQPEQRRVHKEEQVLLFREVDDPVNEISLYVNQHRSDAHIVTWMINFTTITTKWMTADYTKIYLDVMRNIWIDSIDETYEGKYFIPNCLKPPVELIVLDRNLGSDSLVIYPTYLIAIITVLGGLNIIIAAVIIIIRVLRNRKLTEKPDGVESTNIVSESLILPLVERRTADSSLDQSSALQQHEIPSLPPDNLSHSSSLAPVSDEVSSSEA